MLEQSVGTVAFEEDFSALYEAHTRAVFNYCLFRVGDRAAAEDLTADTFERAWSSRHHYRPDRAEFATWLFAIARRVVADWQRRRARRPQSALDVQHPDPAPLPETQIEEAERQAQLRWLVLRLEPHEQELIALKFGSGMTNRAIALILGKSESAIGTALHRVMQKLRSQWEGSYE